MATTIDTKPAAGLFGGAVTTVGLGLLGRYTSYHPSVEEAAGITTIIGFAVAWVVPSRLWGRAEASLPEVDMAASDPHEPTPTPPTDVPAAQAIPAPVVDPASAPVVSP